MRASLLQLTFDADDTIYEVRRSFHHYNQRVIVRLAFVLSVTQQGDGLVVRQHGMDLEPDSWIVDALLTLMQQGPPGRKPH